MGKVYATPRLSKQLKHLEQYVRIATHHRPVPPQRALALRMKESGETAATICKTLGIGRTTLYRYLAA